MLEAGAVGRPAPRTAGPPPSESDYRIGVPAKQHVGVTAAARGASASAVDRAHSETELLIRSLARMWCVTCQ